MNTLASTARPASTQPLLLDFKSVVLFYLFLGLPLFDMLNGFLIGQGYAEAGGLASPSQIGRFAGILLMLAVTIRFRFSPYFIVAAIALCLLEAVHFFTHSNASGLIVGYVYISRFLYMYLAYVFFLRFYGDDIQPLAKFLKYNVVFISLSVIFANYTGLANSTYGWGSGTKGFFASGNGLGIYIGVAALILAALKKYRIYPDVSLVVFGLAAYTLVLLGTKTSFLMLILVLAAGFWSGRFRLLIIPAILFAIIQYLGQISEGLAQRYDIIILRYENSQSLDSYILSNRNVYTETAITEFLSQDPGLLRWVFGSGAFLSFQNPLRVKSLDTLETDFMDVFFMYGLVGLIFYVFCFFISTKPYLKSPWMLLPIVMLWGHSAIAGHVLFNGLGATLMVMVIAMGTKFQDHKSFAKVKKKRGPLRPRRARG